MLRKSKRLDYHENEPSAQVYRYTGTESCVFKMFDSRGNADVERHLDRPKLLALWKMIGAALADWPVDGNTAE